MQNSQDFCRIIDDFEICNVENTITTSLFECILGQKTSKFPACGGPFNCCRILRQLHFFWKKSFENLKKIQNFEKFDFFKQKKSFENFKKMQNFEKKCRISHLRISKKCRILSKKSTKNMQNRKTEKEVCIYLHILFVLAPSANIPPPPCGVRVLKRFGNIKMMV